MSQQLPSKFQIDDSCTVFEQEGTISGVTFRTGKVTYDVLLTDGGEELRNVDSTFVEE